MSAPAASSSHSPSTPTAPVTASAFLEAEELAARKAIKNTITELKATATGGSLLGPKAEGGDSGKGAGDKAKEVFDEHPYLALLGATAAGFLTAAAVVPSKEQQVLKKLAALERAVALQGGDVAHPKPGGNTLAGTLVGALAGIVKPVILHTVTAALAAQQAAETVAPEATARAREQTEAVEEGKVPPAEVEIHAARQAQHQAERPN